MDTKKIQRASWSEILKRIGPGIILAGVVIRTVIGDNNTLDEAKKSKESQETAVDIEE